MKPGATTIKSLRTSLYIKSSIHSVTYQESVYICLEKDQVNIMFEFEEMGSDKISTGLALDSLHKIRVSCVENHVSARSDAQICFLS